MEVALSTAHSARLTAPLVEAVIGGCAIGDATGPQASVQGCRLRRFAAYPPARQAQYSDDGVGAGIEHDRAARMRTGDGGTGGRDKITPTAWKGSASMFLAPV